MQIRSIYLAFSAVLLWFLYKQGLFLCIFLLPIANPSANPNANPMEFTSIFTALIFFTDR